MLKNCGGGPRPIRLCVEKTSNFDEIQQRRTCKQKWAKILIGPIVGEALGLIGCVLKRLKILMKFNSAGPVSNNGSKF